MLGMNHVALVVGDLEEALAFYGRIFDFTVSRLDDFRDMAFLDMGDQFIALSEAEHGPPDEIRHFGLVVDDKEAVRAALADADAEVLPGRFLDFRDPWGNHIQVVDYRDIQYTKSPEMLDAMGLGTLEKTPEAQEEIRGTLDALRRDSH
jgi:lactoylglutathione lyase